MEISIREYEPEEISALIEVLTRNGYRVSFIQRNNFLVLRVTKGVKV